MYQYNTWYTWYTSEARDSVAARHYDRFCAYQSTIAGMCSSNVPGA